MKMYKPPPYAVKFAAIVLLLVIAIALETLILYRWPIMSWLIAIVFGGYVGLRYDKWI